MIDSFSDSEREILLSTFPSSLKTVTVSIPSTDLQVTSNSLSP